MPAPVAGHVLAEAASDDTWVNHFEALNVYEPSAEFLYAPDIQRPRPTTLTDEKVVYEAESVARNDFEEAVFAFAVMIDDLNKIRQEVKRIWAGYRDGVFELAAAAVATNTAVDLARSLVEEIETLCRPHGGLWKIAQKFYFMVAATTGFSFEYGLLTMQLENSNSTPRHTMLRIRCSFAPTTCWTGSRSSCSLGGCHSTNQGTMERTIRKATEQESQRRKSGTKTEFSSWKFALT